MALSVDDLDEDITELADRGIRGGAIQSVGDAGRRFVVADSEGNRIVFIQVAQSEA